jgi:hypothetical protein
MTRPRRPAFAAPNEVERNAPNEADRANKIDCVDEADRAKPARQTKPGSRADRSQSRRSKSSRQKKLAHLSGSSRWENRLADPSLSLRPAPRTDELMGCPGSRPRADSVPVLGRTPSPSVARGSRQTVESTVVGPSTATMSPPATGPMMARAIPWRGHTPRRIAWSQGIVTGIGSIARGWWATSHGIEIALIPLQGAIPDRTAGDPSWNSIKAQFHLFES